MDTTTLLLTGISLFTGFLIGAAATVALLFFLKRATRAPNLSVYTNEGRDTRGAQPTQTEAEDQEDALQAQWDAMMSYDGTKQKREEVNTDGD